MFWRNGYVECDSLLKRGIVTEKKNYDLLVNNSPFNEFFPDKLHNILPNRGSDFSYSHF